jgi:hypothetical protein
MRNKGACSTAGELRSRDARVSYPVRSQIDFVMSCLEIQLATVLMVLISSGSTGAQVLSGQCDQTSASCSRSSQPKLPVALPLSGQEPPPQARVSNQQVTVTYDARILSVQAHGASLRSVLAAIGKRTGTEIEFAAGSDTGGVYVDLGPATVRDLLRDLLNGSQLNYVMVRSQSDPGFVERLVILGDERGPASADHTPTAVVATGQPASPQLYGGGFTPDPEEDEPTPSVAAPAEQQPAAVAVQPSAAQPSAVQPSGDPSILKYQQQYQQAMADAAATGKTPGQILGELQKLQQKELDEQYAAQPQPH